MAWSIAIEVARQEIHGTDRDILSLYRQDPDAVPKATMDQALTQLDPKDVIRNFADMWDERGPRLWHTEDGMYGH